MFVFLLKSFNYLPIVNMYQFKGEQRILKISPNSIFVLKIRNPLCRGWMFRASEKRRRRGVGGWGGSPPFLTLFFQTHIYGLSLLLSIVNTAARFTGLRFCSLVRRFLCINITVAPSVLQRGPWKIYKTSLWKSRDIRYYFHWWRPDGSGRARQLIDRNVRRQVAGGQAGSSFRLSSTFLEK